MDPSSFCLHIFSCQFGFHAKLNFVGQFEATTLYSRDHGRVSKWMLAIYGFVQLFPHATFPKWQSKRDLFHAPFVDFFQRHHQRYLQIEKEIIKNSLVE